MPARDFAQFATQEIHQLLEAFVVYLLIGTDAESIEYPAVDLFIGQGNAVLLGVGNHLIDESLDISLVCQGQALGALIDAPHTFLKGVLPGCHRLEELDDLFEPEREARDQLASIQDGLHVFAQERQLGSQLVDLFSKDGPLRVIGWDNLGCRSCTCLSMSNPLTAT